MEQRAFLIDISNYQGDMKKYQIVGQLLELIIRGISARDDQDARFFTSNLKGEEIIEVVDLFHTAFFDLEGFTIEGLAKIDTRLFMNFRGLELSVWTTTDEVFSIFVSFSPKQLDKAICTLTKIEDSTSQEFKRTLSYLREAEYSLIFPSYETVRPKPNNEN